MFVSFTHTLDQDSPRALCPRVPESWTAASEEVTELYWQADTNPKHLLFVKKYLFVVDFKLPTEGSTGFQTLVVTQTYKPMKLLAWISLENSPIC